MPTFTEFKEAFPVKEYYLQNKQKITLGVSGLFLIGLMLYLWIKNRGR